MEMHIFRRDQGKLPKAQRKLHFNKISATILDEILVFYSLIAFKYF